MDYIIQTKKRTYKGTTRQEAERKLFLAALHALDKEYAGILHEICEKQFGKSSFGALSIDEMKYLRSLFRRSKDLSDRMAVMTQYNGIEPMITEKQRKRLIRLGLYVLGARYGKKWFWEKCKEWLPRFRSVDRVELKSLTEYEACYLIKRFEKIEKRVKEKNI